ncbi:hypothetical protein V1511DRAFT_495408 [Dipodascopsis uninucleata]
MRTPKAVQCGIAIPHPSIKNLGAVIMYYWKFLEAIFGPIPSVEKIHPSTSSERDRVSGIIDFRNFSDKEILTFGYDVLTLYTCIEYEILTDKIDLFRAAFFLGPEYVLAWSNQMRIFTPRTPENLQVQETLISRTEVVLDSIIYDWRNVDSLIDQVQDELDKRSLLDVGEEVTIF